MYLNARFPFLLALAMVIGLAFGVPLWAAQAAPPGAAATVLAAPHSSPILNAVVTAEARTALPAVANKAIPAAHDAGLLPRNLMPRIAEFTLAGPVDPEPLPARTANARPPGECVPCRR
jgi:hypothetical protein